MNWIGHRLGSRLNSRSKFHSNVFTCLAVCGVLSVLAGCGGGGGGDASGASVLESTSASSDPTPTLRAPTTLVTPTAGVPTLTLQTLQAQTPVALVTLDTASRAAAQPGDSLRYTIVAGVLPSGVTFDPSAGTVQGTPTGVAHAPLQLVASRMRGGTTYTSTPISVAIDVNSSLVSAAYDQTCSASVGSPLSCTPSVVVAPALSGETLTFIAPDMPAGFSIDPVSGKITGTSAVDASISIFVTLRTTFADGSHQDDLPEPQPVLTVVGNTGSANL